MQTDGKIVVAGHSLNSSNFDFALARYNPDGSLDASFDTDGKVTTDFSNSNDYAFAVAIQTDGKIVAAGESFISPNSGIALVRYNTDGSLDTSFNGTGKVFTSSFGADAKALAIQTDGKIVVAGSGFTIARYNTDGSLDASFDGDGIVITMFGGLTYSARGVAIQSDGKIVAAGESRIGQDNAAFALARYNANGSLDTSFDGDGKLTTDFGPFYDEANAVAIQAGGKIIAAGYGESSNTSAFALVRYNTDGSLDSSFDGDGKVTTPFGVNAGAIAVAIQSNGKIVAAGGSFNGTSGDFALVRYNTDASLDASFGNGGKVSTSFGNNSQIYDVAIQADGKIVAAGSIFNASNDNFAVARYIGDAAAPQRTLFDFDGDGKADISVFRPSNSVWYLQQSQAGFTGIQFGLSTDRIVPADYDGDGKTDIAVYRDGTWYLQRSTLGFTGVAFGASTDIPAPADFDGDGKSELAVFRPSNGVWYLYNLAANQTSATAFGQSGDKPVPADYDGDGKSDIAVFRDGTWYLQRSTLGFTGISFGAVADKAVRADYDGDGRADVAVFRPSNGTWYLLQSSQGFTGYQFGVLTDSPVPADYDGDGKTDIAVFRDGTWYLQRSAQGFTGAAFGAASDKPVPAAFVQ
jgi:uncharacterized delta-60 repeat protein